MKKNIVLMAVVILLLSLSTTDYSMAATSPSSKMLINKYGYGKFSYGMTATRNPNITIFLNNDGTANVYYDGTIDDIKYQRLHDRILVGREQYDDLLYLLNKASDMSGEKYDLTINHRAWVSPPKCFGIDITAYEGIGDTKKVYKRLEFASPISEDGITYGNALSKDKAGNTYYVSTNGDYIYSLPLRYIFEQLGFTVEYENNTITISYN